MRLSKRHQQQIKQAVVGFFDKPVEVFLFGSRADDTRRGGDIDIMVKINGPIERPAVMAANIASRLSRLLDGRNVDVVIQSDTLKHLPIHEIAERTGIRL